MKSVGEEQARCHAAAWRDDAWAHPLSHPQLWAIWADWGIPPHPGELQGTYHQLWLCSSTQPPSQDAYWGTTWGSRPHMLRDGASPNHLSYPKEEITFISLSLLIISSQVWGPSGPWMLSGCLWKEKVQVPNAVARPVVSWGGFLLFPSPRKSSCPWSFFHLPPLSLRTAKWQSVYAEQVGMFTKGLDYCL